ncbi:hypothetical protein AB0937_02730 [Streptomyces sp. NPDC047880]|uniref:hypothetical protein n=1 Tax=Streptomyces sp. NPDC047880 TaxID=3155626 RepID=UPI0034531C06
MRRNFSKGMIVASAASSILSLWAVPALADSGAEEATGDRLSTPTRSASAFSEEGTCAGKVAPRECDVNIADDQRAAAGYGDDSSPGEEGTRRTEGALQPGTADAPRSVPQADVVRSIGRHVDEAASLSSSRPGGEVAERVVEGLSSGHGERPDEEGGYGDDSATGGGYGDDGATGGGYGDDGDTGGGYGDDGDTGGGYGETPAPTPSTPPVTPPDATPPVTPPAANPHQPPSMAETGAGRGTLATSGIAAALVTGGVLLYRRGRVMSCK